MNKLKYILIAAFIIFVIVIVFNYFTSKKTDETVIKNTEIDNLFNIWLDIAGAGDRQTLAQNELPIKQDLAKSLNSTEVTSLKQYSISIQDLIASKNTPFSAQFIGSMAYLTSNFKAVKQIIEKTSASKIFSDLLLGPIPQSNYTPTNI